MSDKEFLTWIRDRIVNHYGESPNVDFVHRLNKIIDKAGHAEAFVVELATIYGLDEHFLRALPTPTLEMWQMLVREEAKRHKSERETMENFRAELNELKFSRVAQPSSQEGHSAMECTMRSCAEHRDLWRHYEDNVAQNAAQRDETFKAELAKKASQAGESPHILNRLIESQRLEFVRIRELFSEENLFKLAGRIQQVQSDCGSLAQEHHDIEKVLADYFKDAQPREIDLLASSSQAQAGTPRVQAFWDAQAEWSRATFGSDSERDHVGPLKHLAKEAVEAQVRPSDPTEIADCLFLVFDAARRSGLTLAELLTVAEEKLEVNKARKWNKPAAGEAFAEHVRDEPIEHVRVEAQAGTAGTPTPEEADKFVALECMNYLHCHATNTDEMMDALGTIIANHREGRAANARSEGAEAMRQKLKKLIVEEARRYRSLEIPNLNDNYGEKAWVLEAMVGKLEALSLEMPDTPQKEKP